MHHDVVIAGFSVVVVVVMVVEIDWTDVKVTSVAGAVVVDVVVDVVVL